MSAPSSMRQRLAELRQQAEQTLEEVHDLAVALRPSVLDDVGSDGRPGAALPALCAAVLASRSPAWTWIWRTSACRRKSS